MNALRRKNGFTLIELLAVIAIIAMLLAILIPVLGKVKTSARKVICKSNLKQWSLVFGMYAQDNGGRFVPGASWGGLPPESFQKGWAVLTRPYYEDEGLLLCPMVTKRRVPPPGTNPINGGSDSAWKILDLDRSLISEEYAIGSYGLNFWVSVPRKETGTHLGDENIKYWGKIDVRGSYNVPLLGDHLNYWTWPRDSDLPPENDGQLSGPRNMETVCTDRHQGEVNHLFMDFSIRSVGLKELWRLDWHRDFDKTNPYADPDSPIWNDYGWIQKACR